VVANNYGSFWITEAQACGPDNVMNLAHNEFSVGTNYTDSITTTGGMARRVDACPAWRWLAPNAVVITGTRHRRTD
jgi:hypothetical protein